MEVVTVDIKRPHYTRWYVYYLVKEAALALKVWKVSQEMDTPDGVLQNWSAQCVCVYKWKNLYQYRKKKKNGSVVYW